MKIFNFLKTGFDYVMISFMLFLMFIVYLPEMLMDFKKDRKRQAKHEKRN